jgi:isopentenyldiphosphate isomerase
MEYLNLVNEKNEITETKKTRKEIHRKGLWHASSHVWVLNEKNEILCNLRSKKKDTFPLYWDAVCGEHLKAGENFKKGALRGLKEELKIEAKEEDLIELTTAKIKEKYKNIKNNELQKIFLFKTKKKLNEITFQKSEIKKIKFIEINELKRIIKQKEMKFIPKPKYYLKIIKKIQEINDKI